MALASIPLRNDPFRFAPIEAARAHCRRKRDAQAARRERRSHRALCASLFLIGVALGIVLYVGSRLFSPDEERTLTATFGTAWNDYEKRVKIPWL